MTSTFDGFDPLLLDLRSHRAQSLRFQLVASLARPHLRATVEGAMGRGFPRRRLVEHITYFGPPENRHVLNLDVSAVSVERRRFVVIDGNLHTHRGPERGGARDGDALQFLRGLPAEAQGTMIGRVDATYYFPSDEYQLGFELPFAAPSQLEKAGFTEVRGVRIATPPEGQSQSRKEIVIDLAPDRSAQLTTILDGVRVQITSGFLREAMDRTLELMRTIIGPAATT